MATGEIFFVELARLIVDIIFGLALLSLRNFLFGFRSFSFERRQGNCLISCARGHFLFGFRRFLLFERR